MGCTPSHSTVASSIAKSGIQFLKKPKAILPGRRRGSQRCCTPLQVKSSTCYDPGGHLPWRQRPTEELEHSGKSQSMAEDLCQLTGAMKGSIPETQTSPSQVNKSQSRMPTDIPFRRRSSPAARQAGLMQESGKESATRETSQRNPTWDPPDKQGRSSPAALPTPETRDKVDFSEPLVKAHQRAYSYLHASLSRYEVILHHVQQASQTRALLQPMLDFLLLCFEEVSRLLGEISKDGEVLLREVRGDLAGPWKKGEPWGQPDLLQQLLQYTVSKLQAVHSTVATLTGVFLVGSSSYLHSTASSLESGLKTKRGEDERLLRALGQLESLASGHSEPGLQGPPLYSEDSGVSADNESVKSLDKPASWDFALEPGEWKPETAPQGEAGLSGHVWQQSPSWTGSDRPQHCPLSRPVTAKVQPAAQGEARSPCASGAGAEAVTARRQEAGKHTEWHSVGDTAWDSVGVGIPGETQLARGSRLMDGPSLSEGEDSSPEEQDRVGEDPCAQQEKAATRRPRSSPADGGTPFQPLSRKLRSPQTLEMILKMKEAISERIKFVPVPSRHQDWAEEEEEEEEEGKVLIPPRPSTVSGSGWALERQRRSPSEGCLGNPGENPTLQELRRVQSDLAQRLEVFYALGATRQGKSKKQPLSPRAAVLWPPSSCRVNPSNTTSKLKASLTKNFSILPSQDKSILQRCSLHPEHAPPRKAEKPPSTTPSGDKDHGVPGDAEWAVGGSPAARISVKKLIETFSPPESLRMPGDSKNSGSSPCLRKWRAPVMPPRFPLYRGLAPLYPKPRISPAAGRDSLNAGPRPRPLVPVFPPLPLMRTSEAEDVDFEAEDLEDLPPPPLEILMDRSFTALEPPESREPAGSSPEGTPVSELEGARPPRRTWASSKLRASMNPMDLLPSKGDDDPLKMRRKGPGSRRGGTNPRKDLSSPPSVTPNPGTEGGALGLKPAEKATSLSKHDQKAISEQRGSPAPGRSRTSLAKPPPAPRSPEASRQSRERNPPRVRKASPTRARWATQGERRPRGLPSSRGPPQTSLPAAPSSPSPPLNPGTQSPPFTRKPTSAPWTHHQPSPDPGSPRVQHGETHSPSSVSSSSPPASPSQGSRPSENTEASAANALENASSICCSAAKSLFPTAHPPAPPSLPPEPRGSSGFPAGGWRNGLGPRPKADTQRPALGALDPLPLVRRTVPDHQHQPGDGLQLPGSSWEAQCSPSSSEDSPPWSCRHGTEQQVGGMGRASLPELCVLGHGLQPEPRTSRTQDRWQPEAQPQPKEVS